MLIDGKNVSINYSNASIIKFCHYHDQILQKEGHTLITSRTLTYSYKQI